MIEPAKLIAIMKVMLSELERSLAEAPAPLKENGRSENLKTQIDRLKYVLKKHQDHDRRKRELEKQNRDNTRNR